MHRMHISAWAMAIYVIGLLYVLLGLLTGFGSGPRELGTAALILLGTVNDTRVG